MNKKKILNDPVYGFISIPSELIFDLIEHRYFQRLRRIKQVGLTHYVYPGALHTRFHHALGAMHLMQTAIATLRSKEIEITADEAEAAMIAILLHDIGHGPYSHALEGVLINASHESLTRLFLKELNRQFDGALDMAIAIFEGTYRKDFLHQLIASQLDLDRLDYLKRDSFFTGVAEGNIGHDRIIKMLNVVDDQIVIEQKGIYSIEKFIVARRLMYWQVYLHKAVIGAEQMLKQLLLLLRVRAQQGATLNHLPNYLYEFVRTFPDPAESDDPSEILHKFAEIDDVDVGFALKVLSNTEDRVISLLATNILERRLFHTQLNEQPLPQGYIDEITRRTAQVLNMSEDEARQLVIPGHESIPTYKTADNEILMLLKDGRVVPLSRMLNLERDSISETYYLCYPKESRLHA
ncbi:MAG: HD domain-containing protein [Saprospiraceae bacterium]|nr:HD domain-containing protein [Saprospiraceae bacterium]